MLVPGIDGSLEAANAADLLIVLILTRNGRVDVVNFEPSEKIYHDSFFWNKQPDWLVWYGDSVNKELWVQLLFYYLNQRSSTFFSYKKWYYMKKELPSRCEAEASAL
jgi:hypothetical protein